MTLSPALRGRAVQDRWGVAHGRDCHCRALGDPALFCPRGDRWISAARGARPVRAPCASRKPATSNAAWHARSRACPFISCAIFHSGFCLDLRLRARRDDLAVGRLYARV